MPVTTYPRDAERFLDKVEIDATGCWLWAASRNRLGYGHFTFQNRVMLAHRWAFWFWRGPIADGLLVCHSCDVPSCVNPDHLWLGTNADNVADRDAKGRHRLGGTAARCAAVTHCPQGHPYDEKNTYYHRRNGGRRVTRECRACRAVADRRRRARNG
jgi:hypothetical protein